MNERTALYRHFAADGTLLYVGISLCAVGRLAQHRAEKPWYDQISRVDVEWLPTREQAIAAEKYAIQVERPLHNIIHTRSWKPAIVEVEAAAVDVVDDFPAELSWPISAKFALIAWGWNPKLKDEGIGAVAIGYQPHRCGSPWWFDGYECTAGACDAARREMSDGELKAAVLSDYFMLTQVYEIDPRVVTQAFLNIQEFRDAIEESPMGPNLMFADLPCIEKKDPRPERRFWHSIHVFPRDVRLVEAA